MRPFSCSMGGRERGPARPDDPWTLRQGFAPSP